MMAIAVFCIVFVRSNLTSAEREEIFAVSLRSIIIKSLLFGLHNSIIGIPRHWTGQEHINK